MISPVFLIIVPLIAAFISISLKKFGKYIAILTSATLVAMSFMVEIGNYVIGGYLPPYGINLNADGFSIIASILINSLIFLSVILNLEKVEKRASVVLVLMAGLNGMLMTGDLFNLFVFMEITAISAYILSGFSNRLEGTINYLAINSIGSGFYLLGIIILYVVFGNLNMSEISYSAIEIGTENLVLPLVLIFIGLSVETKLLPMNGWVKNVYSHLDSLSGPLFSSAIAGTFLVIFGRIFSLIFPMNGKLLIAFTIIAVVTVFAGEVAALSRKKIREILLFSSIGQAGLVALLFLNGLFYPAMIILFNNVVAKFIMFYVTGRIVENTGEEDYTKLKGVFFNNKVSGLAFTVAGLSLIGLPGFVGFIGKINSILGLFGIHKYLIPVVILIATIVEGAYIIRLIVNLWNPGEEDESSVYSNISFGKFKEAMSFKVLILVVSGILLVSGILPNYLNIAFTDIITYEQDPSYILDFKEGN
jgi:multicomponent Na+:H+ antiporter subunit D